MIHPLWLQTRTYLRLKWFSPALAARKKPFLAEIFAALAKIMRSVVLSVIMLFVVSSAAATGKLFCFFADHIVTASSTFLSIAVDMAVMSDICRSGLLRTKSVLQDAVAFARSILCQIILSRLLQTA